MKRLLFLLISILTPLSFILREKEEKEEPRGLIGKLEEDHRKKEEEKKREERHEKEREFFSISHILSCFACICTLGLIVLFIKDKDKKDKMKKHL